MERRTGKRRRFQSGRGEEDQASSSVDVHQTKKRIEGTENDDDEPEIKPPTAYYPPDEPAVHQKTDQEKQKSLEWGQRFEIKYGPIHENLRLMLHKFRLERGGTFKKSSVANPRYMESTMAQEVYEQGPSETVQMWDEREATLIRNHHDRTDRASTYCVEHIICSERRRLGDIVDFHDKDGGKVLIKWETFPVPSWEPLINIRGYTKEMFWLRCILLDYVENDIRAKQGTHYFDQNFPHRYLEFEKGRGRGGYVEDERSLYKNRLLAVEALFNSISSLHNQPTVYVEDWSNKDQADGILKEMKYSQAGLQIDRSLITTQPYGVELERGRQKPLLIFRDPVKGWCIRAVYAFNKNEFVAEYCSETENEAWLFAHSCYPNCELQFTRFKREALPLHKKRLQLAAVTTKRNIIRGEELTVDKTGGMSLEQLGDTVFNFIPASGCTCGTLVCRFSKQKMDEFRRVQQIQPYFASD